MNLKQKVGDRGREEYSVVTPFTCVDSEVRPKNTTRLLKQKVVRV